MQSDIWTLTKKLLNGIKNIIQKENINCDFENQDAYVYATSLEELTNVKNEVEAVKELDFPCEFVKDIPFPIKNLGAIKFPNQGQFNPRKYALSLCDKIEQKGIEIYENSVVTDITLSDDGYLISVNDVYVKAKHVILATHYPIVNFPGLYFLKMYQSMSYVIALDTKTDLPEGMYINSEIPTYSFRTASYQGKKILLVAGSDHKVGEKINLENAYDILEKKAKELYPESEVLYRWCTEDCISLDKIPYIGDFSNIMPNLHVATGFKKWGITFSYVASKIITDKILGIENPYEELGNMIKESMYSLVINKLKESPDTLEDVNFDEGKIIELDGNKVGVYRDKNGKCFFIKPTCAHLGCELSFNDIEKTWDCPCHGSRYTYEGKVICEPAINDLEKIE